MPDHVFEDFYQEFKDKVYTHVYYRVGNNREAAADITSEVFLKAFKNFSRYDRNYAFSTWVFTITRNVIIDYRRKHQDTANVEDYVDVLEGDDEQISTILDRELDLMWLGVEIENLPEKQSMYLSHRLFAGKSVKEIAQQYNAKEDTIRKNIQRATKTLLKAHKNRYVA